MTTIDLFALLAKYVAGESLQKHCFAVEAAMYAYGARFGENPEEWAAVGLLHDIDFELYPEEHPKNAAAILKDEGFSEDFITNVLSHARDWPGQRSNLQKVLLAVDELTGFILACAMVRPDKSLENLELRSVMKKLKDKAFARAVDRELIKESALALGIGLEEHIGFVMQALVEGQARLQQQRGRSFL